MTGTIEPLVPKEVDLRDFQFMPMDIVRLFNSDFHARANDTEWRAGVTLWLKSYHQVPAASLPDDDVSLARLAEFGRDIKGWAKIKKIALYGWVKCSDGRLYHPIVSEKAMRAWTGHHRLRHAAIRKFRPDRIKGSRWKKIRERILERDGFACVLCGAIELLEIDHIKPLAEGGTHHDDNLRVLCLSCNRRKSYKWIK